MIDLHTHLIPGVDDGSESTPQSVAVLKTFAARGVSAVCCTPHLKASELAVAPHEEMEAALADLRKHVHEPRLVRGFEIMLDVPSATFADRRATLGGTRYVLVEFHRLMPGDAGAEALRKIAAQGLVPVLAHPERYTSCSVEQAQRWRDAGAVMQVDATTLMGDTRRAERARALVEAGQASLIASDNHGDGRNVGSAVEWLRDHGARVQAELLAVANPAHILADEPLEPVPAIRFRRSWYSQLKAFVIGGGEA